MSLDLVVPFLLFIPFPHFCLAFCTLYSLLMLLCHCLPDGFSFRFPAASLILQSWLHLRGGNKTLLLLLNQVVFVLGNERVMPSNSLILEIGCLHIPPACKSRFVEPGSSSLGSASPVARAVLLTGGQLLIFPRLRGETGGVYLSEGDDEPLRCCPAPSWAAPSTSCGRAEPGRRPSGLPCIVPTGLVNVQDHLGF